MSDVRNKANGLNTAFPIAGVNNSSQGWRDNTSTTQQALFQASDELEVLQKTRLRFTGDASGQSAQLFNAVAIGAADLALDIAFTLASVHTGETTIDTTTQDFALTFDAKGRVLTATLKSHPINWADGNAEAFPVQATGSSLGTGTGQLVLPTLTFDGKGRLTATGKQTINYGLYDQKINYGSLLIGGVGNLSRELVAPTGNGTYALVANGPELAWQVVGAGTVSGVIGGPGIKVTGDASAPTVALDLSQLTSSPDIVDTDDLIYQDASDNVAKRLSVAQFRNKLIKVSADAAPQLGGNLDVKNFRISSTFVEGVVLQSEPTNAKATLSVTPTGLVLQGSEAAPVTLQAPAVALNAPDLRLNGAQWPTMFGGTGQVLTQGEAGLIWATPTQAEQVFERTFFVMALGNDANDGSFTSPVRTIGKAISLVPDNSTDFWSIVVMGGRYTEDLLIQSKKRIAIEGMFSSARAVITGKLNVSFGVDVLNMNNLVFDNTARAADDGQPVMLVQSGLVSARIRDCDFLRINDDASAINLFGQTTGAVQFLDCNIVGQVQNLFDLSEQGELIIESLRTKLDKNLPIVSTDTERQVTNKDVGRYLRVNVNGDNELTVPENSTGKFKEGATIRVTQIGTGRTSIIPLGNTTINTPNGYRLRSRFSSATLTYVGNDTWDLYGDLDLNVNIAPSIRVDADTISVDNDSITVDNG